MSGNLGAWLTLTLLVLQVLSSKDPIPIKNTKEVLSSENPIPIQNPNELPIESSLQKRRWFELLVVRSINEKRFSLAITNLIISYVYEPIVPVTGSLCNHVGGLYTCTVPRNGHWLLSTEWDSQQYLYLSDLATGHRVRTFETPDRSIVHSCAIADSRLFVVAGGNPGIYLWNTNSEELQTTLIGHEGAVGSLCIALNDTRIVSGSSDQTVRIWSVEYTPGFCLCVLQGHTDSIYTCVVSPDCNRIISASIDDTFRVWDSHTKKCIHVNECTDIGDESVTMSEDNQHFAYMISNRTMIKLWNINNGECVKTIVNPVSDYYRIFYYSTDRLVFGDSYEVCAWNLETNKAIYTLRFGYPVDVYVQSIKGKIDRKCMIIVSRTEETRIEVYSFENGELIDQ